MSVFFATALALATSAAMRVMRFNSSSVTIGLLAKPHTPLWITRTPKPAAPGRPPARAPPPRPAPPRPPRPPPNPPPPSAARSLPPVALTPELTLRVKRTSAYEQPTRFASPSTMSASPLNEEVSGLPFGDCAISSPTRSLEASRMLVAPVYFRKSRRVGLINLRERNRGVPQRSLRKIASRRSPRSLRFFLIPLVILTSCKSLRPGRPGRVPCRGRRRLRRCGSAPTCRPPRCWRRRPAATCSSGSSAPVR